MNRYKRYLPIVALVLVALGVNLERFGIDPESFADGGPLVVTPEASGGTRDDGASTRDSNDALARAGHASRPDYPNWSTTSPNINLWHVFAGEINRGGKPVGYHSRPGGEDPPNARLVAVRDAPNRLGVYTARVAIRDDEDWKEKFSTFFPDAMDRDAVIEAILHAYRESPNPDAQPFEGPSGHGFRIQGYTSSRGGINTAFPIYVANP